MRIAAIATVIAGIAFAGAAGASPRISDADFIKASRCGALASAQDSASAEALAAYVKTEARARNVAVKQMADKAAEKARREARSDSAEKKAALDAELGGACQAYIGADRTTGQAAKSETRPAS